MKQFGNPQTRELISLNVTDDGLPDWPRNVPPGRFLRNDPNAPWHKEPQVIGKMNGEPLLSYVERDPEAYPDQLFTPPDGLVPLVKVPQPDVPSGMKVVPRLEWFDDRVERQWDIVPADPEPVPESVTPRQLQKWLLRNGYLTTVLSVIEGLPEPARSEAKIDWEMATEYRRADPLVATVATIVGLTSAETDQAFREAALL